MSDLADEQRERFENSLRWHFAAAIEEGKDSVYVSLGVSNALSDLDRVVAERESALLDEVERRFREESDPSIEGIWREAVDLLTAIARDLRGGNQ